MKALFLQENMKPSLRLGRVRRGPGAACFQLWEQGAADGETLGGESLD
jgi:hypothetical protein